MARPAVAMAHCDKCKLTSPLGPDYQAWKCPICGGAKSEPKKSKYNNQRVEDDGYKFDSKKEWMRYRELKQMEAACLIIELQVHPRFPIPGKRHYVADFSYRQRETGKLVVEDVKSDFTRKFPMYRLKKAQMLELHGIEIVEIIK